MISTYTLRPVDYEPSCSTIIIIISPQPHAIIKILIVIETSRVVDQLAVLCV